MKTFGAGEIIYIDNKKGVAGLCNSLVVFQDGEF
jgi:hypothetical protein